MLYSAVRRVLFCLEPETAHRVTLAALSGLDTIGLRRLAGAPPPSAPRRVMGIEFPNPLGLAAGFDKNAEYIDLMGALGFGFLEVGTVTPRPQPGNPPPRIFRIPEKHALINRLGFNNQGVDALLRNVERSRFKGVLGINIGKNFDTPIERAHEDYLTCLRRVYAHASYVAVNISSPNTPGLRDLQNAEELDKLLGLLKNEQQDLAATNGKYVPIAVKIAPDLGPEQVEQVATLLVRHRMDGVIATNTTLSREGLEHLPVSREAGGLSGAPLRERSTAVLRRLSKVLEGQVPIVGVGGIFSAHDAQTKLDAGASLVQVYTGFIYRGPALIREVVEAVARQGELAPVKGRQWS